MGWAETRCGFSSDRWVCCHSVFYLRWMMGNTHPQRDRKMDVMYGERRYASRRRRAARSTKATQRRGRGAFTALPHD